MYLVLFLIMVVRPQINVKIILKKILDNRYSYNFVSDTIEFYFHQNKEIYSSGK
jgi:hypothetical protein